MKILNKKFVGLQVLRKLEAENKIRKGFLYPLHTNKYVCMLILVAMVTALWKRKSLAFEYVRSLIIKMVLVYNANENVLIRVSIAIFT